MTYETSEDFWDHAVLILLRTGRFVSLHEMDLILKYADYLTKQRETRLLEKHQLNLKQK